MGKEGLISDDSNVEFVKEGTFSTNTFLSVETEDQSPKLPTVPKTDDRIEMEN